MGVEVNEPNIRILHADDRELDILFGAPCHVK